ncbi:hypothetical protein NDU88_000159 [Pleurodeles waltl]|uniref:Uncharacterized protein n=1 Tax=Pleurodeles waltl TaxID=8319 RepID=A0AAV7LV41_PLEWA|nr:hypothetical protein NDU88_000159 [Pleurodeles waltl]
MRRAGGPISRARTATGRSESEASLLERKHGREKAGRSERHVSCDQGAGACVLRMRRVMRTGDGRGGSIYMIHEAEPEPYE